MGTGPKNRPVPPPNPKPRRALRAAGFLFALALALVAVAGAGLIFLPATPLPEAWNPARPLRLEDPVTPVTGFKLWRASRDGAMCRAALAGAGAALVAEPLPDLEDGAECGISPRVRLSQVGDAALRPVETSCAVALRLALWERHGLQPAARAAFGAGVADIRHMSSYNCRTIRTGSGPSRRMSLHATAEAIDISGVMLADGRRIDLATGWNGPADQAVFLRAVRDSACQWFATTLGPDFNALHADHFHLQSRGWGRCR